MGVSSGYQAGQLKHRVVIALRSDVPDAFTGLDAVFSNPRSVWAGLFPVSGATWLGSQQVGTQVTHRIVVRFQPGITSNHEITKGLRRFRISRVSDWEERGIWTVMECEELQR